MPKKLEKCVKKVTGKVKNPWAVCVKSTGIKPKKGGGWTTGKRKLK